MPRFLSARLRLTLALLPLAAGAAEPAFQPPKLTVPPGFTIELVAGPPLVLRPISIAFDELGRLYVTDSSGNSSKADQQAKDPTHRVLRLEDTDGDGKFDKSTVFADKMMFPEGAMFYEGSLYVAAPPQIWKLTDTNNDGVADKREVWHDGKTLTGCANDLHGPYLGPDGWFYWCKGAFAEQRYTLPNGKPFVTRASHIFRARPDGTGLEPVLTGGMDNPVGVAFHSTGERFLSCTFVQPGGGFRDGLLHAIYGGVYGKEHDVLTGHPRTGDLMPVMTHMGAAAPCGLTTYRSRVFGGDYFDNLFACYFNLRKVSRHELIPDGATFKTKDTDFVTSDSIDFHPTDVLEDADGSLLVVDTGGWYKICCPTSQLGKPDIYGGIYRVRRTDAPRLDDPRGLKLAWTVLKPAEQAKLLSDPRLYVRQRAIHELGKRGEAAVPVLRAVLMASTTRTSTETRLGAVNALARIDGKLAREAARAALNDTDATVIQAAVHTAGLWRDLSARDRLETLLHPSSPQLARAAAEALGRIGSSVSVRALLATAGRANNDRRVTATGAQEDAGNRALEHSLIFALVEIGRTPALESAARESTSAGSLRAAFVALDQLADGGLQPVTVTRWLTSFTPVMKDTAVWIVSHRPEWGGALATSLQQRLARRPLAPDERTALQAQLAQLAKHTAIQELLVTTLRETAKDAQLTALRAMAAAGLKATPAPWLAEITRTLAGGDAELVRQSVATARALVMPKDGHAELNTALLRVAHDAAQPADVRLDALAAVPGRLPAPDAELFAFLCAHTAPGQPVLTRGLAAGALARAKLSGEQLSALTDTLKTAGPLEIPKLLPAFDGASDEALGVKLVAALKQSAGLSGVRGDNLRPRLAKFPAPVKEQGEALLASLNTDAAKQQAHLETLLAGLKDGDIRRGQLIFNSAKAACSACHAIGYLGGKAGPDLTRIGGVRTERDLLESIVYPSASFVRSYEPYAVRTRAGDDFSGVLRKDAADEVVLATGPETEVRIARADIVQMRPGAVSLMPAGLDEQLTKQELADLVAFLKASK